MSEKLRCMTGIYLTQGDKILLLYRQGGRVVNNVWVSSAGGHFEKEELNDPQACVLRELREELGILPEELSSLALRYISLRRTNGEIRQNYYFFAELSGNTGREFSSNEGECRWFDRSQAETLPMPYSARCVMDHYLQVGMNNDRLYVGVANGQEVVFTELPPC